MYESCSNAPLLTHTGRPEKSLSCIRLVSTAVSQHSNVDRPQRCLTLVIQRCCCYQVCYLLSVDTLWRCCCMDHAPLLHPATCMKDIVVSIWSATQPYPTVTANIDTLFDVDTSLQQQQPLPAGALETPEHTAQLDSWICLAAWTCRPCMGAEAVRATR